MKEKNVQKNKNLKSSIKKKNTRIEKNDGKKLDGVIEKAKEIREKKNMDEIKKNSSKNKNIIIIAIVIVVVLVLLLLLIKGCSKGKKENKDKDKKEEVIEKKGSSEENIKEAYGVSKEDAINIVKEIYNGDSYEFTCEINNDSQYVVTVKNTITQSITKYIVDPESKDNSFYEIDE